jgi:hypothetical protein
MESINYYDTPNQRRQSGNFFVDFMGYCTRQKELNECKYCGHSLVEAEDPMICSECNSWQGKTKEEEGEELSDLERGN